MAAVLGLDDDQVEVACNLADAEVWVANFNAPGQVVIAGSHDRRRGRVQARPRARRQAGDVAAGVGRVPHVVHGGRPRPPARRDRRRRHPRHRDPGRLQRRRQAHDQGAEWTALLSAQLVQPGALEALPADAVGARCHRVRRARPRAECSPAWPSAAVDGSRTISVATPEDLDKLLEWVGASAPTPGTAVRG